MEEFDFNDSGSHGQIGDTSNSDKPLGIEHKKRHAIFNWTAKEKRLTRNVESGERTMDSGSSQDSDNSISTNTIPLKSKDSDLASHLQMHCVRSRVVKDYEHILDTLNIELNWRQFIPNTKILSDREMKQQEALWELVETEQKYIRLLSLMTNIKAYLVSLQIDGFLQNIDPELLLHNVEELFKTNLHFWITGIYPCLQNSRTNGKCLDVKDLGVGFLNMDECFQPYVPFCIHQLQMLTYVEKKKKEDSLFGDFLEALQGLECLKRLNLKDIMAAPMQRLTKYPLLLKSILKYTVCNDTRKALDKMITSAETAVNRVNEEMFLRQQLELLQNINDKISFTSTLDAPFSDELDKFIQTKCSSFDLTKFMPYCKYPMMRRIIHTGSLKLRDNCGFKGDVTCILFTDLFLVCRPEGKNGNLRALRAPCHIERLMTKELLETAQPSFVVIQLNEFDIPSAVYCLNTKHHLDTVQWMDLIAATKSEFTKCKNSTKPQWSMKNSALASVYPKAAKTSSKFLGDWLNHPTKTIERRVSDICLNLHGSVSWNTASARSGSETGSNCRRLSGSDTHRTVQPSEGDNLVTTRKHHSPLASQKSSSLDIHNARNVSFATKKVSLDSKQMDKQFSHYFNGSNTNKTKPKRFPPPFLSSLSSFLTHRTCEKDQKLNKNLPARKFSKREAERERKHNAAFQRCSSSELLNRLVAPLRSESSSLSLQPSRSSSPLPQ